MDIRWRNFIWNSDKEKLIICTRGITFKEAAKATLDKDVIEGYDDFSSQTEDRLWHVGMSPRKRVLFVITTEREGTLTRIVTVRKANKEEQTYYANAKREEII